MTIPPRTPMAPLAGSLAASLPARSRTLLTFPGVADDWPTRLAATLAGKPWLADWTADVVGLAAAWAALPEQQRTGWFDRDLSEILVPSCDAATAGRAPFALAGTVLGNLAALRSLQADGLAGALAAPNVLPTGHSAGLLAAATLGGDDAACARTMMLALVMGAHATSAATAAGMAVPPRALAEAGEPDAPQPTPMAAVAGPSTPQLRDLLARFAAADIELAMVNTRTRHVLSGPPASLEQFRQALSALAAEQATAHRDGHHPGTPLVVTWEALRISVPFHHSALTAATHASVTWARQHGVTTCGAFLDPATGTIEQGEESVAQLVASVLSRPQDWQATLLGAVDPDTTLLGVGDLQAVHGLTAAAVRGTGAVVIESETRAGRRSLLVPGADQPRALDYADFLPQRDGDRLVTRHTHLTGRSPIVLAGMTPTTVDAGIVAAAANAGHVSELAGGGQVSAQILTERMAELGELLEPGQEVVFNALFLDPYLWDLHLGRERLVQKARAAGAPLCGITVSAGIPEVEQAVELLDELHGLGMWLNAFKPGSASQVRAVLAIAAAVDRPLWLHLEGGAAGGHHSWEDLEEVLLATYHEIREHDHVVLCAGGGVGTPGRAAELLTGRWSRKHGLPDMPVDAVLIGTAAMAAAESTASPQVKQLLASVTGVGRDGGWVRRGEVAGGVTSGRSGLNADIHYVDNAAARAAALLDDVAGDERAVQGRRDEIVAALSRTAKPYFGDPADMTYEQLLQRFVGLVAVGSGTRYQDGIWLDPTHRSRFLDLLQRAEARLHPADHGRVPTRFADRHSVDDPAKALAVLVEAHPQARTALLHPADVDHFGVVCRRPGKPVPFVPVIDADVRRWYTSDALWQAHDAQYDADAVLIIPGPRAVGGITSVDEPVAELLARHERAALPQAGDRRAPSGDRDAEILHAALAAPAYDWAGVARPNPLGRLAGGTAWRVADGRATWQAGNEAAELRVRDAATLELSVHWPALAPGDGSLAVEIAVTPVARGLRFGVSGDALARAGRALLSRATATAGSSANGDAGGNASDRIMVLPDDPMAHAAVLRASDPLPDAAMALRWPEVFDLLAEHASSGALDLVHVSHEIARGSDGRTAAVEVSELRETVASRGGVARARTAGLTVARSGPSAIGDADPGATARTAIVATEAPVPHSAANGHRRNLVLGKRPVDRGLRAVAGGAIRLADADDDGYTLEVTGAAGGFTTWDRFFVRQPGRGPSTSLGNRHKLGERQELGNRPGLADRGPAVRPGSRWVDKPHRQLGILHERAPARLEAFARVTGDHNPIHRSDALARFAGLPGRIVHGMWTSALGQRAAVELACGGAAERLVGWQVSFVAPVEPGAAVTATATRTGAAGGATRVDVTIEADGGLVATGVATVAAPRTAYVFPGQGIQHQGMGMPGYDRSPAARQVWERADAHCRRALGFSILSVIRDNPTSIEARQEGRPPVTYRHPAGVLHLTQFTQVAMATLASAQVAELREAGVFDESAITAGHSVGEYNALAAVTGVLSLEAVLELVHARGMAMHQLVPRQQDGSSDYRLGVIRPNLAGLDHAATEALVRAVGTDTGELCEIVNHNLRGRQYAVAGTVTALAEVERRLGGSKGGKRPFLLVPGIDVPFHSSALRPGVAEFRAHLERRLPGEIDAERLEGRYVPNLFPVAFRLTREYVHGVYDLCGSAVLAEMLDRWEALSPGARARTLLIELLAWQFASPVRWIETTDVLCGELGAERIIEIGVGAQPTLTNIMKAAVALPSHRGRRPRVLNVEADADEVLERTASQPPADPPSNASPRSDAEPEGRPEPAEAPAEGQPDQRVDPGTAMLAVVAIRTGLRPDQLGDDAIETLVDGASSRRNQLLMDLGKEFGVTGMDGAHEAPLSQVAATLSQRASGYHFPGPVLATWLDAELGSALGRLGSSHGALRDRVSGHWGLGAGWADRTALELALGMRPGASRRGGDLAVLSGGSAKELIDAAVTAAADRLGVAVAPPASASAAATLDPAAVAQATGRIEDLLAGSATDLLARMDRLPKAEPDRVDTAILDRLDGLDAEHGAARAQAVRPRFDPRRHVHLASATAWARADVDHLVHLVAARGRAAVGAPPTRALVDQIALHRQADPRIVATLHWYADRAETFGSSAGCVRSVVDQALNATPRGIAVDLRQAVTGLNRQERGVHRFAEAARSLAARPGPFGGQVAVVTGASPGSIAFEAVRHLLRGGATVVAVTSNDSPERVTAYRDLERACAGPGAQLHVVPANLASFADVDALVEWLVTPTTQTVATVNREVKPALWPTLLLPFAASPSSGSVADAGAEHEVALRLMLLGVQRLVGLLGRRIATAGRSPIRVVLPMSPNHGSFGGDGAYSDAKAALETLVDRWTAEQNAWGAGTRLVAAEIGWVRGTGLMAANDRVAATVEETLGIRTFDAAEMGALIAAACEPGLADLTEQPWRIDLTGGLSAASDVGDALRDAVACARTNSSDGAAAEGPSVAALPNLPWAHRPARPAAFEVRPQLAADDMIVVTGVAELGPWGGSATRWAAELGELSADAVTDLAWRMGLVSWDAESAVWLDDDGEPLAEHDVRARLAATVSEHAGVREFEVTAGVDADGVVTLTEVYLDRPLTIAGVSYPVGTAIRVPSRRSLLRQVGGQFPTGVDPTRHGLEPSLAQSVDPLAAWNLVVTAEAIAAAGVTPEELGKAVHPGLIGNVQGTGMGGMSSLRALHLDPVLGREHANDLLQEALGNVVSAHVNQSLVGGYGPMVHPVAACATAAVSLEEAVDKIRLGKAEIVVAGGWDDLSSEGIDGFAEMAATADNAELTAAGIPPRAHSRPGDRRRRGFVESQGGGSFLVTRGSVALRLGLPVRAVVAYVGSFGDGVQTSIPAPGLGALGAARGGCTSPLATALAEHGLTVDDIAVVSKHDTSTNANDPNEAMVHARIQERLGRSEGAPLRVISQKSLTGHAKGGAAAWQLAGLCDVFATSVVPGNHNLTSVDPDVTPGPMVVDYRNLHRAEPVRAALLTSLGFGHVSAVVALAHSEVFSAAIPADQREDYLRRSGKRAVRGQQATLRARHGGPPLFRRRTERMDQQAEIDLLLGGESACAS